MTSVPPLEFTPTGLVVPQESAVLAGVRLDIDRAFGGGVNPDARTPQGQLAASQAAVIADKNAQIAYVVNQVNPDTADGAFQDAIGRIYFIDRIAGAPTIVQCVCSGALGVIIPFGAQAQDTSGNRYTCVLAGQIGVSGSITLPFANVEDGPIPCPEDTLTKIYQVVPGWDSINNPTDGIVGRLVESRAEFEQRREQSVALNSHGSIAAVRAAVADVDGVIDLYAYENNTGSTILVGSTSYPMVRHSLYVAAIGGIPEDIARAIWSKKDLGCNYNGNTEVIIQDSEGYLPPYPEYTVKYQVPAQLPVFFNVRIVADPNLPSNIVALVKTVMVMAFNGTLPNSTRVRIGSLLVSSRFVQYVQAIDRTMAILEILVGTSGPATENSLLIGIDQSPTLSEANVLVTLV